MTQQDIMKKFHEDPNQAKQFNEVAMFLNEAFNKEMPVFMKLVQFDVLTQIQKKAVADDLKNTNEGEKQLTQALDQMLGQINKDLKNQIEKACESLKAK